MVKKPFSFKAFTAEDAEPLPSGPASEEKKQQLDKFTVNVSDLEFIPPEEDDDDDEEEFEEVAESDLPAPTKTIHVYEK